MPPRPALSLLRPPRASQLTSTIQARTYSADGTSPFSKYATQPIPRRRPDPTLPRAAFNASAMLSREGFQPANRPRGAPSGYGYKAPHNPSLEGGQKKYGARRGEETIMEGGEKLPIPPTVPGINERFQKEKNADVVPSVRGTIQLVAEDGENKGEVLLRTVLQRLDRRTHVLQKVDEKLTENPVVPPVGAEGREEMLEMLKAEGKAVKTVVPVCRLYSIEGLKAAAAAAYQEMRAKKKEKKGQKKGQLEKKEFRMSWGINGHDLAYRFKQIGDYLDAGARVEILLVYKRGMAMVEKAQMTELLTKIKAFMAERDANPQSEEGILGKMYMMTYQGKRLTPEQKVKAEKKREEKRALEKRAQEKAEAAKEAAKEEEEV